MRQARCVKATRGRGPQNTKRNTENHKRHTTPQTTRKSARVRQAAKSNAHARTSYEPLQAQQGIATGANAGRDTSEPPHTNVPAAEKITATSTKPPPYHPHMLSRPFTRKEVWHEGHPHINERREPHATGVHTTATKNTYHKPKGTR